MSRASIRLRRSRSYLALLFALVCIGIAGAAWSFSSSSARASISEIDNLTTATHAQFFAYAAIVKPTYTILPLSPTPPATDTSISALQPEPFAEVVADTPAAEHALTMIEDAAAQNDPAAPAYSGGKYILIDISEQHMYVYDAGALVYSFIASTGMDNSTRVGSFSVLDKIPNAYGANWDIWMPNWLGIYWAGDLQNGIHALPILSNGMQLWAGYLGTPISFGCIVIDTYESQLLYDWAEIGTPVEIQW